MTDSPYGVTPGGAWPPPGPPAGPPPAWPPVTPKQSRAPVIISLVVALIAVAIAIGAWFKPSDHEAQAVSSDTKPQYSGQQVADAKKAMCDAYDSAYKASANAGGQTSDDPTLKFVIAVNTRLATQFAANYLAKTLDQNPPTPSSLTGQIREIVALYDQIVLGQLSGTSNADLRPTYDKLDATGAQIAQACQ
jgi:hypothetical protein